jgi:hypothetical protein
MKPELFRKAEEEEEWEEEEWEEEEDFEEEEWEEEEERSSSYSRVSSPSFLWV